MRSFVLKCWASTKDCWKVRRIQPLTWQTEKTQSQQYLSAVSDIRRAASMLSWDTWVTTMLQVSQYPLGQSSA